MSLEAYTAHCFQTSINHLLFLYRLTVLGNRWPLLRHELFMHVRQYLLNILSAKMVALELLCHKFMILHQAHLYVVCGSGLEGYLVPPHYVTFNYFIHGVLLRKKFLLFWFLSCPSLIQRVITELMFSFCLNLFCVGL